MAEPGTLQHYIDKGARLFAHHERLNPFCCHSAPLDLAALAAQLGPDFDIVDRRAELLTKFRCRACGTRGALGMNIVILPARSAQWGEV